MGHVKSFFSGAMLCAIWLILLQVLGNSTSSEAAASVRLVDGSNSCSGRVQVLSQGKWLTVCYRSWFSQEANVVCRELGCGKAEVVAYSGQNSDEGWISQVMCDGNEDSLTQCGATSPQYGEISCPKKYYAGVNCQSKLATTTRLVNGMDSCSGRVEVLYEDHWGTVSDDGWDLSDAAVVCREIGCGDAVEAKTAAYFGQGFGPVLMNLVDCFGNETTLKQCKFDSKETDKLTHLQDAGVICNVGEGPDEPSSVKMLLRIEVKTDSRTNPNDPEIMSKLSEEMEKLQISEPFTWNWKTQPDGKVFQKVPQKKNAPKTPCH